jgi:sugar phosphate isomerase/epimerase
MKLSVTTYSFSKYIQQTKCDYFKICDLTKEMGFEGIEFVNLDNWEMTNDCLKTAKELREYCAKIGLEIVSYTVGANLLCDDVKAEVARIKGCVDVAEALGAPVMRHDVVWALRNEPLYTYRSAIKEIAPLINEITEYAKSKGIRTCTENHGFVFQSPERVEELILAVNNPNYGWLCDMGNFLCADADPIKAVSIAAPYAFHVHAKDFLIKSGTYPQVPGFGLVTSGGNYLRGTVVGHGEVPVRACVNALKKAGYDGWLSLEFEGAEDCLYGIQTGLDFLKTVI